MQKLSVHALRTTTTTSGQPRGSGGAPTNHQTIAPLNMAFKTARKSVSPIDVA